MDDCDPRDVAIKSFFLGPQCENKDWLRSKWIEILDNWMAWRSSRFPSDGQSISQQDRESESFKGSLNRLDQAVSGILRDLESETIKFTPRYIGHMVSEISMPALLGHVCAILHNPNNTSREVSRVTSRLEEEAIADLAKMLGFPASVRGHFTSGGTVANFEALWRSIVCWDRKMTHETGLSFLQLGPWSFAREYQRVTGKSFLGPVVLVPHNKHFSWEKAVSLMGLGDEAFWPVDLDEDGRQCTRDLRAKIEKANSQVRPVLLVVSVAGTTEMGEVDPVGSVQDILDEYRAAGQEIWHHVDGAYGGYYASMLDGGALEAQFTTKVARALRAIRRADSVTLDPHKLGYVPYACGAFLARDEERYRTRTFKAAYLKDDNEIRWATTLEGSRSGAGVTATWLANRTLGLDKEGYGRLLAKGFEARERVLKELQARVPDFLPVPPIDLNIICFSLAKPGERLSDINRRSKSIFEKFEQSPNFSVSKTILHFGSYHLLLNRLAAQRGIVVDADSWYNLRLVLMNPFLLSKESKVDLVAEFVSELLSAAE